MNKAEVIFYHKNGSVCNEPEQLDEVTRVKAVGLSLTEFQQYLMLDGKDRVKYIMEHGENFNY